MAENTEIKTTLKNWDDVDSKFKDIATANIKHTKAKSEMDKKILEIQKDYADTLDALTKEITTGSQDIINYCKLNKSEFEKNKSKILHFGEISYKLTPPALKFRDKFDLPKVISKIKALFKGKKSETYIKVTEDINKSALKSLDAKTLKSLGLETSQNGVFTITPNEVNVLQSQIDNQTSK